MGKNLKAEIPNSSPSPSYSNIFKSLFGGSVPDSTDPISLSIFSDSNPFRAIPTNHSHPIPTNLQDFLHLDVDSPNKTETQIPNSANQKSHKRKRNEKIPSTDSDESEIDIMSKKSKMVNEIVSDISKRLNFDKKKRKRGEVEAEYEERKYGGLSLNLEESEGGKVKVGEKRKKLDEGEDMLVPKEGFDDEEKLLRTVFVGNLPLKVKKKSLIREFGQFGQIESIRIRSVPLLDDKTPRKGTVQRKKVNEAVDRVNAYIVFETEDSAQASLSHNMAVVGGNHIHVDRACPPRKKLKGENTPLYDSKRTVQKPNLTPSKRKGSLSMDSPGKKLAVDGNASYQGSRASKSGFQKIAVRMMESTSQKKWKRKQGMEKRRPVAAPSADRKKRKPESLTPESDSRRKKARKFK